MTIVGVEHSLVLIPFRDSQAVEHITNLETGKIFLRLEEINAELGSQWDGMSRDGASPLTPILISCSPFSFLSYQLL